MATTVKVELQDLAELVVLAIWKGLSSHEYFSKQAIALARKYWEDIPDYYKRQIVCNVQVAVELNSGSTGEAVRDEEGNVMPRKKLRDKEMWQKFIEEFEPPKAEHTIDYRCGKCKKGGLKLWREVHSGKKLRCAKCLAPRQVVDDEGLVADKDLGGNKHDQVNGWLPACPVGDTFWGYSSVPSADVRWWKGLPTYSRAEGVK